jgi:hypothetical protein
MNILRKLLSYDPTVGSHGFSVLRSNIEAATRILLLSELSVTRDLAS